MSIVVNLYKQSLIHQKNNAQLGLLRNSASKLSMLGSLSPFSDLSSVSARENALDLENISASAQLMAINAELEALNSYSPKLDFKI